MYALIVGVIALVALAYVAAPTRRERSSEPVADPLSELEETKTVALTAILDLEDERDMGKLTDEDLAELRSVYEAQALAALQQMDEVSGSDGSDPLEREIARVRERLTSSSCPACGASRPAGTSVCPRCGA